MLEKGVENRTNSFTARFKKTRVYTWCANAYYLNCNRLSHANLSTEK